MASKKVKKVSPKIEPIKILARVIMDEMEITKEQIMLGLENYHIPKTDGLYIALLYGSDQTIGNNNYWKKNAQGGLDEIQEAVMLHGITLEVMSFNKEARLRKEEVLMAINSTRAQQLSEANNMRINSVPESFVSVPDLEPGKQLNRFQIIFNMNAIHRKVKSQLYYDKLRKTKVEVNA